MINITYPLKTSPNDPLPIFSNLVNNTSGSIDDEPC